LKIFIQVGLGEEENMSSSSKISSVLSEFKSIAEEFGIDTTDLENNLKSVYRQLVTKVHPDKYPDPKEKEVMTIEIRLFQLLYPHLDVIRSGRGYWKRWE
jgi:hypothetical protein